MRGEGYYFKIANFTGLQVFEVPQDLLPFQRVSRMKDGGLCLHNYCDSEWSSPGIPYLELKLRRCAD